MRQKKKDITQRQLITIKKAAQVAVEMQRDMPEIAKRYEQGEYMREIIENENLIGKYGITYVVAKTAMMYALRGYDGGLVPSFTGLIEDESLLEKICHEHKSRNGKEAVSQGFGFVGYVGEKREEMHRKSVETCKERNIGIYGFTTEQRKEIGKKSAETNKRLGTGLYGLTTEEKRAAAIKSVRARGLVPFSSDEDESLLLLYDSPEFAYQEGRFNGKPNWKRITSEVNDKFSDERKPRSTAVLRNRFYKLRKRLENK